MGKKEEEKMRVLLRCKDGVIQPFRINKKHFNTPRIRNKLVAVLFDYKIATDEDLRMILHYIAKK